MSGTSRTWFSQALETVAVWWRVERADGVSFGFTSHDRDLWFGGLLHRTAPGMVPSAVRRTADFEADSAEIAGALSHDSISETDLAAGRFDGAAVAMGLIDWETYEQVALYSGTIGAVGHEGAGFTAELHSLKETLGRQIVPRTSPTCRAEFCGEGCTLAAPLFTMVATIAEVSANGSAIRLADVSQPGRFLFGMVRCLDGADNGLWRRIEDVDDGWLVLDRTNPAALAAGMRAVARQGCDHTLETCQTRFSNAINFQGEPFLPGNDMLGRYPAAQA